MTAFIGTRNGLDVSHLIQAGLFGLLAGSALLIGAALGLLRGFILDKI